MNEAEQARTKRAAKLREEIEQLKKGRLQSPRSPHEFVEEQMRKRAAEATEDEGEPDENPPRAGSS